jgi:hypothetical protein
MQQAALCMASVAWSILGAVTQEHYSGQAKWFAETHLRKHGIYQCDRSLPTTHKAAARLSTNCGFGTISDRC